MKFSLEEGGWWRGALFRPKMIAMRATRAERMSFR